MEDECRVWRLHAHKAESNSVIFTLPDCQSPIVRLSSCVQDCWLQDKVYSSPIPAMSAFSELPFGAAFHHALVLASACPAKYCIRTGGS